MSRRPRFRSGSFALAAVLATVLHALAIPAMFLPLLERPERPVEVAFVDDQGATAEAAKLDPAPEPREPPVPPERRPPPPRPEAAWPEPAEQKKAQPPPPPPPQEKKKVEPPPPEPALVHQKMVDQDKFPDEADNAEAKYLAQKNHRAERDTRALLTNLVRDMKGPSESPVEKSERQAPRPGMKDEKIAELQKRAGEENQVVRGRPRAGDAGSAPRSAPGKLSMRGLSPAAPMAVEQRGPSQRPREGVELSDPAPGPLAAARQGNAGERVGARARGERPNLHLDATAYDRIVGEAVAQSERDRAARAEVSHAEGRWDRLQKRQAALRASLENFTNEAYTGRESELGTRAHPYAAYIAEMHRSIHKLWAFSFLPSLDSRGALDPFNDMSRWTRIAIVLSDSGAVESTRISRNSGYLPFDVEALSVVEQAGPFPKPPEAIKSYDGKVYIDWVFHRDERQCGTDFVVPHILSGDKHGAMPAGNRSLHARSARSPL